MVLNMSAVEFADARLSHSRRALELLAQGKDKVTSSRTGKPGLMPLLYSFAAGHFTWQEFYSPSCPSGYRRPLFPGAGVS
jgi:hypothetical protein